MCSPRALPNSMVLPPDALPRNARYGRALPSRRASPDQATVHCDLNITVVAELSVYVVFFQCGRDRVNSAIHSFGCKGSRDSADTTFRVAVSFADVRGPRCGV